MCVTVKRGLGYLSGGQGGRPGSLYRPAGRPHDAHLCRAGLAAADILIHPELGSIDMWSFRALDKAVEAGYRAAAAGIERIKQGLVVETPKLANFWR